MKFHKLLVIASAIQSYVHKILRTVRGAENPTGPKLPDFTLTGSQFQEFSMIFFSNSKDRKYPKGGNNIIYNNQTWSVQSFTYKKESTACQHFLVMSPDPYFYFISRA